MLLQPVQHYVPQVYACINTYLHVNSRMFQWQMNQHIIKHTYIKMKVNEKYEKD